MPHVAFGGDACADGEGDADEDADGDGLAARAEAGSRPHARIDANAPTLKSREIRTPRAKPVEVYGSRVAGERRMERVGRARQFPS
jgi:hypothetical protein